MLRKLRKLCERTIITTSTLITLVEFLLFSFLFSIHRTKNYSTLVSSRGVTENGSILITTIFLSTLVMIMKMYWFWVEKWTKNRVFHSLYLTLIAKITFLWHVETISLNNLRTELNRVWVWSVRPFQIYFDYQKIQKP